MARHNLIAVVLVGLAVLAGALPPPAGAQRQRRKPTPNDKLVSPEVHPDKKVTFRIYAPKASEVTLRGDWMEGGKPVALEKDKDGVWSVSVGPLVPDLYNYSFSVDGVKTIDPKNPTVKQGISGLDSMFFLPGKEADWERLRAALTTMGRRMG